MVVHQDGQESRQSVVAHLNHLSGDDSVIALKYWRELFHNVGSQARLHCFPLDYQWPRSETTVTAADGIFEAALLFSSRYDIHLDDLIYGVWAIVSAWHLADGQRTTVVTASGLNRSFFGHDAVIGEVSHGDFPLVLTVPGDMEILSWLRHVGSVSAESCSHAHLGYKQILKASATVHPQVKVSIDFDNYSQEVMSDDDDFPLVFNLSVSTELKLSMRHNLSVPKMDVRILLDHFAATLSQVIENPYSNISTLHVTSPIERELLYEYGKSAVRPSSGLLHHLIERQARLTPDADAIQYETEATVTYSALNRRSNQLARQIRLLGEASYVAVHMAASVDFIVALLAVLKAGAAYVILDPGAQVARKSFMIDDVRADLVLVDDGTAGKFPNEHKISELLRQSSSHDKSDLVISDQTPSDVAYVIYTSGSTGNPKAVLLEHQAAFNGLLAFPAIADLRQLLFFNPVFSAAQRSIWATLSVGGCLCLASKENLTVNLASTINIMNVNSIDMTSTTASLISPDDVPSLRRMALGGEVVSPAVVHTWAHRVDLLSSYGLSECTQLNWRYKLRSDGSSRIIGQPFDTTTSYILVPETTNLSPLLIPGELCLGGAQLARGYSNAAEETEKRFIANPFGQGKLYRTGDMAVRHADGSIEMIGRIDFQVKINGQRIDPGEPNSIIQEHGNVEHSAVVPALINEKMSLVAVIVSRAGSDWSSLVESLRSHLATRLPLYMVPAFWFSMPSLPLNANGKVDMSATQSIVESLGQQPLPDRPKIEEVGVALNRNEKVIRQLWAKFLSLPEAHISLDDSFVSLGGTSLEAIQVVSRLKFDHSLSLRIEDIIFANSLSRVASLAKENEQFNQAKLGEGVAPFALLSETSSLEPSGVNTSDMEDAFPVTPFQEAVIANTMMGGTNYIYSRAYNFDKHSQDAVKNALGSLMKTERFLRTTFVPKGTSFMQIVQKTAELPIETHDMSLQEYLQQHSSSLMHPGQLWWRVAILPENILVITTHHALFDYWSNEFLQQDLTSLLLGTAPIERPAFNGYVEYLQQHNENMMQEFWIKYLAGAKSSRLGPHTGHEDRVTARLGRNIKSTASKLKVTPSVLLYAAWSVVLSVTSAADDVVMGVTLSGRDAPVSGILQMNGPTLMIAPLRVIIDQTSSFEAHLMGVQSSLWEVAKHAPYGLRNILKASGQLKDLFDTMVNFLIKIPTPKPPGGLTALPENNLGSVEHVKLELANESLDRITLTSTLDPMVAQCLADSVAAVLNAAIDTPAIEVGQLKLIQPMNKLVDAVKEKEVDMQAAEPLAVNPPEHAEDKVEDQSSAASSQDFELGHSSFLRMAASYPWKTAVQDASGNSLTYAGLAIKADQLASVLRARGVVPEHVVPIMFEKSINTVVAILGILISGGAFLPLGPENPRDRNLGILEESEAQVVITDRLNAEFFKNTGHEIIVIDDIAWDTMPIKRETVPSLKPDSLAYVIYTSGSTGKPKGTLITHKALATTIEGVTEATNLDTSYRILWALNYIFDGSYDSFFSALSNGSTLCVAPQSAIMGNLAEVINKMEVSRVNLTPTMTNLFHPDEVPTLKVLVTGGEAITANMQTVWTQHMTVYNAYGPTEATICISTRVVTPDLNPRNIGYPFKKVTALILDPDTMEPVPNGTVGELCVSGPQVARGYLKRPDATDKVFHERPNGRVYQTGDLAKFLPNGEIELFGRKDDQVKINGYRIELGEIETVIMQAGVFKQCIVITATVLKKKQLVAFCSISDDTLSDPEGSLLLPPGQVPNVGQIKEQLTTLPHYMIPTLWLPISGFRLTVTGKVDRKHVQALAEGMTDDLLKKYLPKKEAAEMNSEAEVKLRSLWSALFETPTEEIHANSTFHALGGDSISALNLGSMLRREGYEIKINDILSRNTLREQAELMAKSYKTDEVFASAVTVQPVQYQPPDIVYERLSQLGVSTNDVEDIYPLSPGQVEFLTQGNKAEQFWQLMAVRALPADFDFDRWIYLTTKLTKNNQILRALYINLEEVKNPQTAVQVVLKHPTLNLTYRSYSSKEEKQHILDDEWDTLFDPAKPFVRYTLLINSKDGTRDLVIKLDHASYDGTLLHILDNQFQALDKNLPIPKHTPFKEFISHIISTPKKPLLDYWIQLLQDKSFDFPSKVTNPVVSRVDVAKIGISVGIDDLAASSGVTAPIVFQTAYSLLLARLSGSRDVIYNNLITGRNVALDNPQLIDGNCANFLPFHSHVAGDRSIEDLLRDTQAAFWASTENGLMSLGEIYESLGRDRTMSAAKSLFCFQPFEPVAAEQDPMRWIVMKMSKNKMYFNYAVNLEVVKSATKGEYVIRFGYDERAFSTEEAQEALKWYVKCLEGMTKGRLVEELGIWI